jgi:hypothetical protein
LVTVKRIDFISSAIGCYGGRGGVDDEVAKYIQGKKNKKLEEKV